MTRWAVYLEGVHPQDLLEISAIANLEMASADCFDPEIKTVVNVLQQAMYQLVYKSQ